MSGFTEYIGSQFGNPRGIVGKICCLIMNVINHRMYVQTASLIRLPEKSKVLDIGYGNGFLLKLLNKKKYDLYGIDISDDMKKEAERNNRSAEREGRLHLGVGDCCSLPYKEGMFRAAASINTIYFWNDTLKGLEEIKRCLAINGKFYNVVYTKNWLDKLSYTEKGFKKFSPKELVELGYEAGFVKVGVKHIVKGKSFVVIYKK